MSQAAEAHAKPTLRRNLGIAGLAVSAVVIPGAIIALAAGGDSLAYWTRMLAHARLHAPDFALLARVGAKAPIIIVHLSAALTALLIGSVLLMRVKGTMVHRALGYTWVAAMGTTAVTSLFIKTINPGHWSFIHFLSGWVIIALPIGVAMARRHAVRRHARMMTSTFVGGLLVAGLFTFLPGRLMWRVFFG